jgi:hypothetical protein
MNAKETVSLDVLNIIRQLGIDQSKYSMFFGEQSSASASDKNPSGTLGYPNPDKRSDSTT